jgi:hypothetical protein
MNEPIETLQHTEDIATRLAIQYGPRVVSAALILIAGIFITKWMARLTLRGLQRFALEPPVTQLILRVVRLLVFALPGARAAEPGHRAVAADRGAWHRGRRGRACAVRARQAWPRVSRLSHAAVPRRRVHLDRG